jgi:hypothetical protein
MRITRKLPLVVLLLGAAAPVAASPAKEARDPKALAALDAMGAFLRSQVDIKVLGELTTDDVTDDNQKVQYSGTAELTVRRPDRMRATMNSDRRNEQIFYDGKQFTVYLPKLNYYASFDAPPNLAGLIDVAERRYGLDLPLVDLFAWGTNRSRPQDILTATKLGTSTIKGSPCDHYAFHQADIDWQVWIQQGDRPLPRKLVITTITEKTQPQYQAVYTWELGGKTSPQAFTFVPPPGAHRIEFDTLAPPQRQGRPAPKQTRGGTP